MKRVYTWAAQPAERTVTIGDMRAEKGKRKWTQVTANTADEAAAAGQAGLDMIICNSQNTEVVRQGNNTLFLTAAITLDAYPTETDILREAFRVLSLGADAVMTPRSMDVVTMLAKEDVPVMGHLGLVPRKSTWVGGLRAIGKTAEEAYELYERFRRLEDAGAVMVEAEVIPGPVMEEISKRTGLITVSLGSGTGGDVMYLFMEDVCGEKDTPPRHARAFGDLARLHWQIQEERVAALAAFRRASTDGTFPSSAETPDVAVDEFKRFQEKLSG